MQKHYLSNNDSLLKKASYLRIIAKDLADVMKAGNFSSLYKGQGVEFAGVRDYIRGDDVRNIDWNVTARMDILILRFLMRNVSFRFLSLLILLPLCSRKTVMKKINIL